MAAPKRKRFYKESVQNETLLEDIRDPNKDKQLLIADAAYYQENYYKMKRTTNKTWLLIGTLLTLALATALAVTLLAIFPPVGFATLLPIATAWTAIGYGLVAGGIVLGTGGLVAAGLAIVTKVGKAIYHGLSNLADKICGRFRGEGNLTIQEAEKKLDVAFENYRYAVINTQQAELDTKRGAYRKVASPPGSKNPGLFPTASPVNTDQQEVEIVDSATTTYINTNTAPQL